jgi:hypothetical protein
MNTSVSALDGYGRNLVGAASVWHPMLMKGTAETLRHGAAGGPV